jgi:hypothetical protein
MSLPEHNTPPVKFSGSIVRTEGAVVFTVKIQLGTYSSITRTFSSSDPKTAGIRMGEWLAEVELI